ncbi:MAG: DUF4340 domain-containing protein, partial [SAR324 cluster bacterium]|nr:DUF4340 domain-containing protein [SAR324 cluster bacterium]
MPKRNLIVAATLLIIIALFVNLYSKKDNRQENSLIGKPIVRLELVETIDEIVIENKDAALHLHKKSNGWVITEKNEFPANTQKLVELFDHMTTYRLAALITEDKDRLAHFGLLYKSAAKDTAGEQLTLKRESKETFRMVAGKNRDSVSPNQNLPSRPDGTYIRIGESSAVYLIKENINFETGTDEWIQKVLLTMNKDQINSIHFENPNNSFLIERDSSEKKPVITDLLNDETTNEQEVKDLLNA